MDDTTGLGKSFLDVLLHQKVPHPVTVSGLLFVKDTKGT